MKMQNKNIMSTLSVRYASYLKSNLNEQNDGHQIELKRFRDKIINIFTCSIKDLNFRF